MAGKAGLYIGRTACAGLVRDACKQALQSTHVGAAGGGCRVVAAVEGHQRRLQLMHAGIEHALLCGVYGTHHRHHRMHGRHALQAMAMAWGFLPPTHPPPWSCPTRREPQGWRLGCRLVCVFVPCVHSGPRHAPLQPIAQLPSPPTAPLYKQRRLAPAHSTAAAAPIGASSSGVGPKQQLSSLHLSCFRQGSGGRGPAQASRHAEGNAASAGGPPVRRAARPRPAGCYG